MANLERVLGILVFVGLAVILGAAGWQLTDHTLPGGLRPWLLGGLAPLLVYVAFFWDRLVGGIGRRQFRYGANSLVLTLAVLGSLVLVNLLVARNTVRYDLTKDQRYSLSDQTRKVLSGLAEPVKVTYFQRERELRSAQDRLKEYEALSPKLKVRFVDPVRDPNTARQYDVRPPWPTLFIEKGDKRERISNDGEQEITNALIKVTREGKKKTVCLLEGEGERSGEDSGERGFSGAKASLTKSLYDVKAVFLLREKTVPADCTALVVAGPEKDLLPETTAAIRSYVAAGGKALVMVEPELKVPYPNLVALLEGWNLVAGKNVVVDVSGMGQLVGASELAPLAMEYPFHPITKDLRVSTLYGYARSVEAGKASVEGVTAQNLVQTSPDSWAETDLAMKGPIKFAEGQDRKGPISLAAVATVRGPQPAPTPAPAPGAPAGEPAKAPEGRVVAVGDVDFASNALLGFLGNQDLFLNVVAWLAEDADLISIRPKEPENQALFLSIGKQIAITVLAVLLIPLAFIVGGIVSWWRRR